MLQVKQGTTTPDRVVKLLKSMIKQMQSTTTITGCSQISDNECFLNFVLDGNTSMSINIQAI